MQSKECYAFLAIIFFYIYIVNLTNVCRICGSHSDEDDKFWVSYIGRLVLLCIYIICSYLGKCDSYVPKVVSCEMHPEKIWTAFQCSNC